MNQDLGTNIPVDNNNEQQPEEGSEEGFEEESEEGSEEVSEESSEDKGSTVEESSRVVRKKLVPLLLKPDPKPKPELVLRALSPDLDLDSELEDDVEQVLMVILREVKIIRLDLFYGDRKKLKIRNEQYEMILDKKRGSYFNQRKTNGKKDYENPIELDVMKKGKTFKEKGKKYFEGRSKKGNSFGISLKELDKRRKNKLCFKCRLLGHITNIYKKDNKSSVTIKVSVMRILRIMDILLESSEEEDFEDEEENSSGEEGR
ncbi:hypothetical protein B7463_g11232, partial [Scytalidium lignicola]